MRAYEGSVALPDVSVLPAALEGAVRTGLDHRDGVAAHARLCHPSHNRAHRRILGFQRLHAQTQRVHRLYTRQVFHRLLPLMSPVRYIAMRRVTISVGEKGRPIRATPGPTPKGCIRDQLIDQRSIPHLEHRDIARTLQSVAPTVKADVPIGTRV